MADTENYSNGHDDYEVVHENEINEAGIPRHRTKSETIAELRRKDQGQKVPLTKVDYTSHLRKTDKVETPLRERKASDDSPKYLQQLRKVETGIETKPMYVRMARQGENEAEHVDRKLTAEELMDMAYKKAEDAEKRDPAARRGIAQKPASSPSTFEGLKSTNGEKEDYKAALKQHVRVEPKSPVKAHESKPTWANIQPKRVIEADIKSRSTKENKQDAPEWAQFGRGAKKNIAGLDHARPAGKTQAPEWASLVNKTDRRRLIELEIKSPMSKNSGQPEWASKAKDPREILRVENKKKQVSANDQPDYRGALRKGSRKDSNTFCDLQKLLNRSNPPEPSGDWRLVGSAGPSGNSSVNQNGSSVNQNGSSLDQNGSSVNQNGSSVDQNGGAVNQNRVSATENVGCGSENDQDGSSTIQDGSSKNQDGNHHAARLPSTDSDGTVRRKMSAFQERQRRKSSVARFSLAQSLQPDLKLEVEDVLMDWVQEVMTEYEGCQVDNFGSSWEDGVAFCNLLHFYHPDKVPVDKLNHSAKRSNLLIAFQVSSETGISVPISVDDFMKSKVPDANKVFDVLYEIYTHFHGPIVEWGTIEEAYEEPGILSS